MKSTSDLVTLFHPHLPPPAQAENASERVAELQSTLEKDSAGQSAGDQLLEEIARLKAGIAAQKVRLSHITEAMEAAKGSFEEVRRE